MRQIGIWFWMSGKRWLRHPGFAALLVLIPLLTVGVCSLEPEKTERIAVGVWAEGTGLEQEVAQELASWDGMFEFVLCETEKEAREAVETKRVECAYLLPSNLQQRLDSRDFRRCITVYTAPSTVLEPLTGEIVYAALASCYDQILLERYAEQEAAFETISEREKAQLSDLYETYQTDGSTFRFEYASLDQWDGMEKEEGLGLREATEASRIFPARGLTAVLLFLCAFFSAWGISRDEARGLFALLPAPARYLCPAAALAAPVALAGLSCLAALAAAGEWTGWVPEISAMAKYAFLSAVYAEIGRRMVRKPQALAAAIPFLALGLFLVCPVFFDAGRWIGAIRAVRSFLPPAWYLSWF